MEREFFEWEAWDEADFHGIQFYKCTVKKPFGPFKIGEILEAVALKYEGGSIEVYDEHDKSVFKARMRLTIDGNNNA